MLSWIKSFMKRPYKIQNSERKRVGVTARNLAELIRKGCEQFKIDPKEVDVVLEDDGTSVNTQSYFADLPAQTVFIFLKLGESWKGICERIGDLFEKLDSTILSVNDRNKLLSIVHKDVTIEKLKPYLDSLKEDEGKVTAETITEHEAWFKGIKSHKTKSDYMKYRAQSRIKSYYQHAKKKIEEANSLKTKEDLKELLDNLSYTLNNNHFHGGYFARTDSQERICNEIGLFTCEGQFDQKVCEEQHEINPYISHGHRTLFTSWEFDHVIEKSRVVIPTLLEAARRKGDTQKLSWERVYNLLFTRENLKLVQNACHDKAARVNNLDWETFVIDCSS